MRLVSPSMQARRWLSSSLLIALALFAVARPAGATLFCGQTLQGVIEDTDRPDTMVFLAAPGEVVSIAVAPAPGSHHLFTPRWEVFDPLGGRVLTSTGDRRCQGSCQTAPLPTAGTFVLQIFDPGRAGSGAYAVSLEAVSSTASGLPNGPPVPTCARFPDGFADGTQVITRGSTVHGALRPVGETDTFTFLGAAGELVEITLDVTANAAPSFMPAWELFDPQGRSVASSYGACDGPCSIPPLPDVGVYTILLFEVGLDTVGEYDLLLQTRGQVSTTTSTSVSSTTTEPEPTTTTTTSTSTTFVTTTTSVTIAPPTIPDPVLTLESTLRPMGPMDAVGAAVAATDTRAVLGAPGKQSVFVMNVEGVPDTAPFGTLEATLVPPQPSAGFGAAVAVAVDVIAVGAPGASSAFLFDGSDAPIVLQAPIAAAGDEFGAAIAAADGDVVVGAPGTTREGVAGAGRAYRFGASGAPLAILDAPGTAQAGARFGAAIATRPGTVFVGAPGIDQVFAFAGDDPVRTYSGAQLAPGSGFGTAIAATERRVFVGAPGANTVFVLEARDGSLVREIVAPDAAAGGFGAALLLTDTALVVGAPDGGAVFVFDPDGTKLLATLHGGPDAGDRFGTSFASTAGRLLVGAPRSDAGAIGTGAAYLFPAADAGEAEAVFRQRLTTAEFGAAVVASGDDAVVGDPSAGGSVERFSIALEAMRDRVAGPAADDARFGATLAAASDEILVGAPFEDGPAGADVGAVYALADGTLRRRIDDPFPLAGDQFGFAIAVSGSEAVVGAPLAGDLDTGAVHVFDRASGIHLLTLRKPAPLTGDFFGAAVAAEGDQILVGAPLDGSELANAGAVYLFRRSTAMLDRAIVAPGATAGDLFGSAVAITPTLLIVGAPLADGGAIDTGRVYVFDRATGTLAFTLANPTPDAGDQFGAALAIVGDDLLVGAPQDDQGAPDTGAAHLFDLATGTFRQTLRNPAQGGFDRFGTAIAARAGGALVGAPGVSRVYAYTPAPAQTVAGERRVRALAVMPAAEPVCGNGLVEGTEQCDDGNGVDADDCRNDCTRSCCEIPTTAQQRCNDRNPCTDDVANPLTGCSNVDNGSCCDTDADCDSGKCRLCLGCSLYPWDCCDQGSQCLDVAPECGAQDCFDFAYCACAGGLRCDDGAVPSAIDDPFLAGCNELRLEGSFAPDQTLDGNERLKLSRSRAKAARKMVRKAARMARKLAKQDVVTRECRQTILGRTKTVKQAIPKGRRLKRCVLRPADTP